MRARRLRGLSEDAIRFIQYNRGIIETVPLQTYFSAVAFAPECSLIRKAFISNGCDGVPCILNRPKSWGPCVQTLFGHEDRISSLDFHQTHKYSSPPHTMGLQGYGKQKRVIAGEYCPTKTVFFLCEIFPRLETNGIYGYGENLPLEYRHGRKDAYII